MGGRNMPSSADRQDPTPPSSYLIFCLFSCLMCLPFGIAAIFAGTQVKVALRLNNLALAREASQKASRYTLTAFFVGANILMAVGSLVFIIIYQAD